MTEIILHSPDPHAAIIQTVLDGVPSPNTKRAYARALTDFMAWHDQQGRPPLTKATVQRYMALLQEQGLSASSINQRLSAIRKLVQEATDNGVLNEAGARGIQNVKGVRQEGQRLGNWLSKEKAEQLINAPNVSTLKGVRDRALLAVLVGCGLRRREAAMLSLEHIQQREGRWVLVDLIGKRNKIRSVPMPSCAKVTLDEWLATAGIREGRVFRSITKGGEVGQEITPQGIRNVVKEYAEELGVGAIAPHDLRRTFAQLARKGGAALEQIQISLGHSSVQTTERYLGTRQDLHDAPCDRLGIRLGR